MAKRSARKIESDILYNARRRMLREATRAEKAGDVRESMRLRAKAESYKASVITRGYKRNAPEYAAAIAKAAQRATRESAGLTKDGKSREKTARTMLRGNAGSQFMASTKAMWYKAGENLPIEKRYQRIVEGLGARDLLEAIEMLEAGTGRALLDSDVAPDERYDKMTVRLGQLWVSGL